MCQTAETEVTRRKNMPLLRIKKKLIVILNINTLQQRKVAKAHKTPDIEFELIKERNSSCLIKPDSH